MKSPTTFEYLYLLLDAMDEIDENKKSKRNIETKKQTHQPNSRIDKSSFQSEVFTIFDSTQY